MTINPFELNTLDPSWQPCLKQGLTCIDKNYLTELSQSNNWLPGPKKIFNAFNLPLNQVNYVLFGESPYPRAESANGYAFWDSAVTTLWSETGMSKRVNRATSLRHIIKMLLIAEEVLSPDHTTQEDIASLDKSNFVQTNDELFTNFLTHGFLLLNATPVLADSPRKDAKAWHPFTCQVLNCLLEQRPHVTFILLGKIANKIQDAICGKKIKTLIAEHPYNHTFIHNPDMLGFFGPLHLLRKPR